MHAQSRPFLVFERLLSGPRVSCRDAGNTLLCSLVNPTGPSTTRWQFSADNHLNRSFDHFVGAREHGRRHLDAERLSSPEVDGKLEFGRLLNRQVSRLGAFQDAIDIERRLAKLTGRIDAV